MRRSRRRTPQYKCKSHTIRASPRCFETAPLENPLDEPLVAETTYGLNIVQTLGGWMQMQVLTPPRSSGVGLAVVNNFERRGDRFQGRNPTPRTNSRVPQSSLSTIVACD